MADEPIDDNDVLDQEGDDWAGDDTDLEGTGDEPLETDPAPEPVRQSRAQKRIRDLDAKVKERDAQIEGLKLEQAKQAALLEQMLRDRVNPGNDEDLDPTERRIKALEAQVNRGQAVLSEQIDLSDWEREKSRDPRAKAMENEVRRERDRLRQMGVPARMVDAYEFLLGRQVRNAPVKPKRPKTEPTVPGATSRGTAAKKKTGEFDMDEFEREHAGTTF